MGLGFGVCCRAKGPKLVVEKGISHDLAILTYEEYAAGARHSNSISTS